MTLAQYAALGACALLAVLAVFQIALIFGAPLGHMAWGGQHRVLPKGLRTGSAFSILIYVLFGLVLLERAGMAGFFGREEAHFGAWAIAVYGLVGAGLNAISRSRPEKLVMTPLALLLAGLSAFVAMG